MWPTFKNLQQRGTTPSHQIDGVGGPRQQRTGPPQTPMGIVEGGGDTIAHEAAHGMAETHIDRAGDRRPGEPPFDEPGGGDNLMREVPEGERLNDYQAGMMKQFIIRNEIGRACPP